MKKIKIYYGMSGAFKGSTIEALKKKDSGVMVMNSSIKNWKYYENGVFNGKIEYNDLTYGILHLVRLREFIDSNYQKGVDLIIERGITDPLFYYSQSNVAPGLMIEEAVRQEQSLLLPDFFQIERILLVQNDKDFIKNYILQDPYRKQTFKNDPEYYLGLQEDYINFTTRYNGIDQIVRVDDAKDYIENQLGETFKQEKSC